MRLSEPIETKGMFWLPEQPDAKLPGTLKISKSGEITVELTGEMGHLLVTPSSFEVSARPSLEETASDPRRIMGILQRGGPVTLDRCLRRYSRFPLPGHMSTSTFSAELAFVGDEHGEGQDTLFSEFSFSIEGLDAWLSISGIEIERDTENRGFLIRAHVPDDITLTLPDDTEMKFQLGVTIPVTSMDSTKVKVQQLVSVLITRREPQPIEYFSSLALKLCNFLTLALDQTVSVQTMTGHLDRKIREERNHRKLVKIYGQFAPWPENTPEIHWYDALFRYPHVANRLDEMMGKWFENYEKFESALQLYFTLRTQPSQILETKILWLCQALETFHRRSCTETEMSVEEFASLRESLMQNCPPNKRQWLSGRLRNELSFRNRVRRLIEPVERWYGNEGKREDFVKVVCDTRNYLTHYDKANTRNRATGSAEMFELYEKLEALFQLHLLSLIGIDDPSIDSIIQENRRLRRRLRVQER